MEIAALMTMLMARLDEIIALPVKIDSPTDSTKGDSTPPPTTAQTTKPIRTTSDESFLPFGFVRNQDL
jgi:hypothetical protein